MWTAWTLAYFLRTLHLKIDKNLKEPSVFTRTTWMWTAWPWAYFSKTLHLFRIFTCHGHSDCGMADSVCVCVCVCACACECNPTTTPSTKTQHRNKGQMNNCTVQSGYKAPKLQHRHHLMHNAFMHRINTAENEWFHNIHSEYTSPTLQLVQGIKCFR